MPENWGTDPTPNPTRAVQGLQVEVFCSMGSGNHSSLLSLHLGVLFIDSGFVEGLSGSQPCPFLNSRDSWAISTSVSWNSVSACFLCLWCFCPDSEKAAECWGVDFLLKLGHKHQNLPLAHGLFLGEGGSLLGFPH